VLVSEFTYLLPQELIAQQPLPDRGASRMLHLNRRTGELRDSFFRQFPDLLRPTDLIVLNNTRVFPARLYGHRQGVHAQPLSPQNPASKNFLQGGVEVLLTRQLTADAREWQALVRPGRKIAVGERLYFGDQGELEAEVTGRGAYGERTVRFAPTADLFAQLDRLGHVPLPPYIGRHDQSQDRERYQTVYASQRGSAAAPTAGLHFTPEILAALRDRQVETAEITLHVGLGTFQPVRSKRVEDHKLHSERFSISEKAARQINTAIKEKRRVVAVGTTTVRTLEHAARQGNGRVEAGEGDAELFIYPGFEFRVTGALLTNFHLPQSTLLMLVCAFAGKDQVLNAYKHAVQEKYRFYSYGDCMFIA
jgi:S-adenosylmethionine:tRNA ribosyltransferase-isomerase